MKSQIMALLLILAASVAVAQEAHYFVRVKGQASSIDKVAVNGRSVIEGTIASISMPLLVTNYLRPGQNALTATFTSSPREAFTIVVERRQGGTTKQVAQLSAPANASKGRPMNRAINFTVPAVDVQRVTVKLSQQDEAEIKSRLIDLHRALERKDMSHLKRAMKPGVDDLKSYYPEMAEFFTTMVDQFLGEMVQDRRFKMKPFRTDGLVITAKGRVATVARRDGKPVFESAAIKESNGGGSSSSQISAIEVKFKKIGGNWHPILHDN